jgi:hypothetical protein
MTLRPCLGLHDQPCHELTARPDRRCKAHASEHNRRRDQARGTRQARGYDTAHQLERDRWTPQVNTGTITCARCGQPIRPGQRWQLGHTDDRTAWTGPEHGACNEAAGGRRAHGQ